MSKSPERILFLCTGNSCRSILAEALMRDLGRGRYIAYSAGSRPSGGVNPHALSTLEAHGHDTGQLRSKSWDEFLKQDIDLIITLCDSAKNETCPAFPGRTRKLHWATEDPSLFDGSQVMKSHAFERTYDELRRRIEAFLA